MSVSSIEASQAAFQLFCTCRLEGFSKLIEIVCDQTPRESAGTATVQPDRAHRAAPGSRERAGSPAYRDDSEADARGRVEMGNGIFYESGSTVEIGEVLRELVWGEVSSVARALVGIRRTDKSPLVGA